MKLRSLKLWILRKDGLRPMGPQRLAGPPGIFPRNAEAGPAPAPALAREGAGARRTVNLMNFTPARSGSHRLPLTLPGGRIGS